MFKAIGGLSRVLGAILFPQMHLLSTDSVTDIRDPRIEWLKKISLKFDFNQIKQVVELKLL